MVKILTEKNTGKGLKIAIVVARFNETITQRLLDACLDELSKLGVYKKDITVAWVPGAFEIPLIAQKFGQKKGIDAVICLGAVILGETDHYRLVADNVASGIMQVSLNCKKPVIFEVLATETVVLAQQRAELDGSNKGRDAAQAAVQTAVLANEI